MGARPPRAQAICNGLNPMLDTRVALAPRAINMFNTSVRPLTTAANTAVKPCSSALSIDAPPSSKVRTTSTYPLMEASVSAAGQTLSTSTRGQQELDCPHVAADGGVGERNQAFGVRTVLVLAVPPQQGLDDFEHPVLRSPAPGVVLGFGDERSSHHVRRR